MYIFSMTDDDWLDGWRRLFTSLHHMNFIVVRREALFFRHTMRLNCKVQTRIIVIPVQYIPSFLSYSKLSTFSLSRYSFTASSHGAMKTKVNIDTRRTKMRYPCSFFSSHTIIHDCAAGLDGCPANKIFILLLLKITVSRQL